MAKTYKLGDLVRCLPLHPTALWRIVWVSPSGTYRVAADCSRAIAISWRASGVVFYGEEFIPALSHATVEALKQVADLKARSKPTPIDCLHTFAADLGPLVAEFGYRVGTFNGLGVVARKEK